MKVASWIQTYSGRAFDFECMANNTFDPLECATVLSRTLRFGGHTKWPYTVAQHSVLVSWAFWHPASKLVGLLHDLPEVFLGDITAPLKHFLGGKSSDIAYLESRIWEWISGEHGFIPDQICEIKEADLTALATEQRDLMLPPPMPWIEMPSPWGEPITPWHPDFARDVWLAEYLENKDAFQ